MEKVKCYIAGKIGKLPEAEYKKNFEEGKAEVIKLGYEPVSPVDLPHLHSRTWNAYMREDIIALMGCEYLYALSNWQQSPGATIEVNIAKSVGIEIIYQSAQTVTTAQALETYHRTIRDCDYMDWPEWVRAVALAQDMHNDSALSLYPDYALGVYEELNKVKQVSMADSN